MNLTPNFTIKEALEWAKWQPIKEKDKKYCIELCNKHWNKKLEANAKEIAMELEKIRLSVNNQFPQYFGKIGIRPVSWYRPKEWELFRKRSGNSQHVQAWAVDFIVVNVSPQQYNEIMKWIFSSLYNWNGGLARLNKKNHYSFIHIDLGSKRRWEY